MSELPPQMSLGSIITALEKHPPGDLLGVQVSSGLYCRVGTVGSYRGYYEQFALAPSTLNPYRTVAEMLAALRGALDESFEGYKGGSYVMTWDTPVWVSEYGEASGEAVVAVERVWMAHIARYVVMLRTASDEDHRGADGMPEEAFFASLVAAPPSPPPPPAEEPPLRYINPACYADAALYVGRIEPISLPTPEDDLRSVYEALAAVAFGEGQALYPALTWEMHQSELVAYAVEPVQRFVLALRLTTNKATPWQFGSCALAAPFRVEDVRWGVAAKTPVAARDLFVSEFKMCVWHARTAQ